MLGGATGLGVCEVLAVRAIRRAKREFPQASGLRADFGLLELDDPAAKANRYRLSAITRSEFLYDVFDVNLYSRFRDE